MKAKNQMLESGLN